MAGLRNEPSSPFFFEAARKASIIGADHTPSKANGDHDGGLDQLYDFGGRWLGVCVRGGKRSVIAPQKGPLSDARKHFSVDGSQWHPKNRQVRLRLFGPNGLTEGLDRQLELLAALIGRRFAANQRIIRGRNIDDNHERIMISTAIDLVQVADATHVPGEVRVDASLLGPLTPRRNIDWKRPSWEYLFLDLHRTRIDLPTPVIFPPWFLREEAARLRDMAASPLQQAWKKDGLLAWAMECEAMANESPELVQPLSDHSRMSH